MRLSNGDVLLAWPLAQHIITAVWTYNDGSAHNAIDLRAAVGTPVYAAEDGTVNLVQYWDGQQCGQAGQLQQHNAQQEGSEAHVLCNRRKQTPRQI